MKDNYQESIRTDLALEARESFEEDDVEIKGVILEETKDEEYDIKVTTVVIKDERGQKAMGKPIGTYITLEAPDIFSGETKYEERVSEKVADFIKQLLGEHKNHSVLVVGLGNREITPDALGPDVVDHLIVTRHLIKEFGTEFKEKHELESMSAIAPGVMAQTGMESLEIIKGILKETKPSVVIAIDALAARSVSRLNTTIQITDTGISPGSGVGNNRKGLNEDSIGVKVIAIGVPTVVDAATIVMDSMEQCLIEKDYSQEDIHSFLQEIGSVKVKNMFVTPKNVDEAVKKISETVSKALNLCFCNNLVS